VKRRRKRPIWSEKGDNILLFVKRRRKGPIWREKGDKYSPIYEKKKKKNLFGGRLKKRTIKHTYLIMSPPNR
jgi:hypothetical protein